MLIHVLMNEYQYPVGPLVKTLRYHLLTFRTTVSLQLASSVYAA